MTLRQGSEFRSQTESGAAALGKRALVRQDDGPQAIIASKQPYLLAARTHSQSDHIRTPTKFLLNKTGFLLGLALLLLGAALMSCSTTERGSVPSVLLLSSAFVAAEGLAIIAIVVKNSCACAQRLRPRADESMVHEPRLQDSTRSDLRVVHRSRC